MIRSYFILFWRNLIKARTLSFINIAGLALGMTFTIVIGLWVAGELRFDNFHENRDRIAMIMKNSESNGTKSTGPSIPLPLYNTLKNTFPEIELITRLDYGNTHNLTVAKNKIMKFGHFADADFLKIFSFPVHSGHKESMLANPESIVCTRSLAQRKPPVKYIFPA